MVKVCVSAVRFPRSSVHVNSIQKQFPLSLAKPKPSKRKYTIQQPQSLPVLAFMYLMKGTMWFCTILQSCLINLRLIFTVYLDYSIRLSLDLQTLNITS